MQFSFFTSACFPTFINMIFVFIFVLKCLLHNSCDIIGSTCRHIIKKHEKHTALLEPGREHQNLHVSNLIKMTSPNQNLISTDWVTDFINPLAELLRKGQYLPFSIDTGVDLWLEVSVIGTFLSFLVIRLWQTYIWLEQL